MVTSITPQYEAIVASISRRHTKTVWGILSLHVGQENAIKRTELLRLMRVAIKNPKWSDRAMRRILEAFRDSGSLPLASDNLGTGYWIGTPQDIYDWAKWYLCHAFTMLRIARKQLKKAAALDPTGDVAQQAALAIRQIQLELNLKTH